MNDKISYIPFGVGIIILVLYAIYYRQIHDDLLYVGVFGLIALSTYVTIFTLYLIMIKHFELIKSQIYVESLFKIVCGVCRKESFRADFAWFYILGVLVNSLIIFFLGITPAKDLAQTILIIG